jgi:hypothetical protein
MSNSNSLVPPIHVLRGILRRLKVSKENTTFVENHGTAATPPYTPYASSSVGLRRYLLDQYRQSSEMSTSSSPSQQQQQQQLRTLAYEYYTLKNDLAERTRLHQLDRGADVQLSPRELSRRAAARAGLQLPDLDPELERINDDFMAGTNKKQH